MTGQSPESFEIEALPHLDAIYRTARRLTANPTDAEDLAQETFMQAWKSFDKYEPGTNCRAWLFTILFHKHSHYIRKKQSNSRITNDPDDLYFLNAEARHSVPEHLTDIEILNAVDKLPEHYKSVILLADVHEFDYKEVAEVLDIPIGTVMSRLSRARSILRKSLSKTAQKYGIRTSKANASINV